MESKNCRAQIIVSGLPGLPGLSGFTGLGLIKTWISLFFIVSGNNSPWKKRAIV